MACVGSPTETQFATSVTTSFSERVELTTDTITITSPPGFRFARRQDPGGTDGVPPDTSSSDAFPVEIITTTVRTLTFTDEVVVTNTVPQQTLFAPCSTSDRSTTSPTPSGSSVTSGDRSNGPSRTSLNLADSIPEGAKSTTVSEGVTIVVSEYVTTINGVETITHTPIQTLLNTTDPLTSSQQAGVIVGATVGGVLIIIALLSIVFYFRRARQVRKRALEEQKKRQPRHLLEDEADDFGFAAPMGQWDNNSLTTGSTISGAPRLLRPRGSRTGSLFHENVWPPPSEVIQDPLLTPDDLGSSISLAIGIPMDQTMPTVKSPSSEAVGFGRQQRATSTAYESIRSLDSTDYDRSHSRTDSIDPLLDQNAAGRTTSPSLSMRPISPPSPSTAPKPREMRSTRSNLRVSYTADDVEAIPHAARSPQHRSGTRQSVYSTYSLPRHEFTSSPTSVMPELAITDGSDFARDVTLAGFRAGTKDSQLQQQFIPPLNRTIARDSH